jgi:hypothetical protein
MTNPKPTLVINYGAKPGTHEDCTTAVAKAINAAGDNGIVEFSPGEYHFYRENGFDRELYLSNSDVVNPRKVSILVENRKNLRLQGKNAKLIFHDRVLPLAIIHSQKIKIDGLTFDWERPMMSQGTLKESGPGGFTLEIDPKKYPYIVEDERLLFTDTNWKRRVWSFMDFDPKTKGVAYNTGDGGYTDGNWYNARVTELKPGLVRFDYECQKTPPVGHVLVARHGARDHAGTFILESKDVTLSNLSYRFTSGLGILAQYSENITFRKVDIAPDPASGRLFAGHDDGFHISNCKGHIEVDGCHFEGLMDDPMNVHGTTVPIVEKLSDTRLKCRFAQGQSVGLEVGEAGDKISFLDHETLLSRGIGKIKTITKKGIEEFEIEFKEAIPDSVKTGDAIENLTWTPSLTVRNSVFGTVRARGLLVSTPGKVLVENNVFRSSGSAILIAGDANAWYESGAVTDVTIRKNRFENCFTSGYQFCTAIISIFPEVKKYGDRPFHKGIKIEDNVFVTFDAPVLWAKSAGDLTFKRNQIVFNTDYQPRKANDPGLTFYGCENVTVENNELDPKFIGRTVKVEGGKPDTVVVKGWE